MTSRGPRQAYLEGFDVHANVWVSANDRAGLERLCRYVLRPPLAQDRLRLRDDGRVVVELKTAWHDGTTHLVFEPLEFLEKLAAITPPGRGESDDLPRGAGPSRAVALAGGQLRTDRARSRRLSGWRGSCGRRFGRCKGAAPPALLDMGGVNAAGVRDRRFGVSPLWKPHAPDRHRGRSWSHAWDPRQPGPLAIGAAPRPAPPVPIATP
jgi:Putative transposase